MHTQFTQAPGICWPIVCIDGYGCAGHDPVLKASCQGVDVMAGWTRNPRRREVTSRMNVAGSRPGYARVTRVEPVLTTYVPVRPGQLNCAGSLAMKRRAASFK